VLARPFPHIADHLTGLDPWRGLLWATDRLEVAGLPSQAGWQWRPAP
jgi:hypothetical protein